MKRRFVQVVVATRSDREFDGTMEGLYAIADDGTLWWAEDPQWNDWTQVRPLPDIDMSKEEG